MYKIKNLKKKIKNFKKRIFKNVPEPIREFLFFIFDITYNAIVIIALVVFIRTFLISPFKVVGSSMVDTLHNSEFILVDRLSYRLSEPKRGDVIVFLPPITNKYPPKFEGQLKSDSTGLLSFKLDNFKKTKSSFYCQNPISKAFWFCKEKIELNDIIYYHYINSEDNGSLSDANWKNSDLRVITKDDLKSGKIKLKLDQDKEYSFRIYSSKGPEYFVKRIIGTPGDTVKIENGRVYLKEKSKDEFVELDETYLNLENDFNTYLKTTEDNREIKVPEAHYFVLGDNRLHSNDSRHWYSPLKEEYVPFVPVKSIKGRVFVVLWPLNSIHFLDNNVLSNIDK